MTAAPEQIERLLDWTARLREDMTAMPWAEPPPQPSAFDRRDAAEADDFAARLGHHVTPDRRRRRDDETCQAVLDILRRIDAGTGGDR